MSHILTIKTEIRDALAVGRACERLKLPAPIPGTHRLFTNQAVGLAVQLPGWRFPVVCDLASGKVHFDNYEERWGSNQELNRFKQAYAVEKTKLEAMRHGRTVMETLGQDGSIRLTVLMGA